MIILFLPIYIFLNMNSLQTQIFYFNSTRLYNHATLVNNFAYNLFCITVVDNIIATTKIRNNYGAIQSFIVPILRQILDFSLLLLVKLSLLILFCIRSLLLFGSFLVSVLCFFLDSCRSISLLKAIAKDYRYCKRATTIVVAKVGRAITIWEAIQKRSDEPIYKT